MLKAGDKAPEFSLYNSDKKLVNLSDFNGKNVVLLFYPLAFTSTCTRELCGMRDSLHDFTSLNAEVLAISVDSLHVLKKWKQEELLRFVYHDKPLFIPGDTAIYSNTNTILVTMIMEAATKRKQEDLLREKLLEPLNLHQTYYQPHDVLPNSVAQGYFDLYNNNTLVNVSNLVTGSGNGYGGIYSNLFDLQKFINAVLVNKSFLKSSSLALMETYGKTDESNRYGYGIMKKFIERETNAGIGHSGRDLGYTANLFYFPAKGVTHIFLINYGTDGKSNLRESFYQFQEELLDITLN